MPHEYCIVVVQGSVGPHSPFVSLMRSSDAIRSMTVFSPADGSSAFIVTGSDTGSIFIWENTTFRLIRKLEGAHTHRIRGLAVYSPKADGFQGSKKPGDTALSERTLLVSGSDDKTAAVWDLLKGTLVARLVGGHRWFIMSVAIFMPTFGSAPFVVTSGWDNYSVLWNVGTGKPIMKLSPKGGGGAVSTVIDFVSPQLQMHLGCDARETTKSAFLLTTGFDKTITIWDAESGEMLKQYATTHTDVISCAAVFVPPAAEHGLYCITGGFDNTAIVWDLLAGSVLHTLHGHTDWVMSATIFRINSGKPFFALALTGSHDGTAILWDLVHGIAVRKFDGVHSLPITGVRFLPRFVGHGGSSNSAFDDNVYVSDFYNPRHGGPKSDPAAQAGASDKTKSDANELIRDREENPFPYVVTSSEDGTVAFWDLDSVQTQRLVRPSGAVSNAASNGLARAVVIPTTRANPLQGALKPAVGLVPTTETANSSESEWDWVVSLALFAPTDGRRPVLLSGSSNGVATAWDLLSGEWLRDFAGVHSMDVSGVSFLESASPKFVSSKKRGPLGSAGDAGELRPCTSTEGVALLVVTAGFDMKIAVWDFDSGDALQVLTDVHADTVSHLAASAPFGAIDYAFAVATSYDHTASVWNLHSGEVVYRLARPHTDAVTHVCIFKPGQEATDHHGTSGSSKAHPLALTSGVDCIVVVWDLVTGAALRTLSGGHVERIKTVVAYQPRHGDPVVLTGGYDKRAVVWDLNTGAIKKTLTGVHKNWVTSLAVVDPSDGGPPFVVTGGFDGMPVLWDLETGGVIGKLEGGHHNGIRALVTYAGVPGDHGRYAPLIVSAGHDSYMVKWDSQYPFRSMPPRATVQALFELDRAEAVEKGWPRISALSARHGDPLWAENAHMFIRACKLRRPDFLGRFQSKLVRLLSRVGEVEAGKSLLRYTLDKRDLHSVRVLLRCWAQLLNKPICDPRLIKYHPSMLLPLSEVLLVGEVYPAEFCSFLRALRLVPVGLETSMSAVIGTEVKSLTKGCALAQVHQPLTMFDVVPYGQEGRGQPVALAFVPLIGAASVEMLHTLVQASLALGSVEVFDSDVVIYGLRFAWKYYGLRVHAIGVVIFCLFFAIYTPNILVFERLTSGSDSGARGFGWFLQTVTFVFILLRAYFAALKMRYAHNQGTLQQYLQDGWNALEVTATLLCLIGLLARYGGAGESDTSRGFLAVATILLWMLGLYYLRPFRVSGPLGMPQYESLITLATH